MTVERYRETERKFRVHGLFRLPALGPDSTVIEGVAAVRPAGELDLLAVYYDTPDLRLARSRVTLRRRTGGHDEGWHLKLPTEAAPETRQEIRVPLTAATTPPQELSDLVLAVTRAASLEPVTTLRTRRIVYQVLDDFDVVLAELTDDSVSVLDGDHVTASFRELEVELVEGGVEVLDAVGVALDAGGAVPAGYVSKAARALGPLADAPPDVEEPAAVKAHDPAGEVVQAHLARNVAALIKFDLAVRLDEPDSVHQMRVAARRIRSGLKAFTPLVDEAWATGLRTELAWIAGILGAVRDREVLRERLLFDLAQVAEGNPGLDTSATAKLIDRTLTDETAAARASVLEALRSPRYVTLLDALVEAARSPRLNAAAEGPASATLPPLVRRAWRRLVRRVDLLPLEGEDLHWHEARISAKQARYTSEAVAPVFGRSARKFADQLERVTELLGEHQDASGAAATVHALASGKRVSGPVGFALGLLHNFERESVTQSRQDFTKVWPKVCEPRWRHWLEP